MTYPDPTIEQAFIIAVAVMVPLVWAFTHHGNTRIVTLMIWIPLWLFVGRFIYWHPPPAGSLEFGLQWALMDLLMDPMTIAWPVFVLLTFGLIRLSSAHRRRREANAMGQASTRAERAVVDARRQPPTPHAPAQTAPALPRRQDQKACPHCGTPVASPDARYCAGCGIELGYDPSMRPQKV